MSGVLFTPYSPADGGPRLYLKGEAEPGHYWEHGHHDAMAFDSPQAAKDYILEMRGIGRLMCSPIYWERLS